MGLRTLKNLCSSSCAAVGRFAGSFTRHLATTSRMYLEKCFFPLSCSSVGGGFWIVISSTCTHPRAKLIPGPKVAVRAVAQPAAWRHCELLYGRPAAQRTATPGNRHACPAALGLSSQPCASRTTGTLANSNKEWHLHGREARKGRMPVRQLQHRDAKGPDVRQRVVAAGTRAAATVNRSSCIPQQTLTSAHSVSVVRFETQICWTAGAQRKRARRAAHAPRAAASSPPTTSLS